jgi:hypothetical protein
MEPPGAFLAVTYAETIWMVYSFSFVLFTHSLIVIVRIFDIHFLCIAFCFDEEQCDARKTVPWCFSAEAEHIQR